MLALSYYRYHCRFGGFGHIPARTLSSPFCSTKYAEESGWTSLARSETTPRYSKRSPMVLISASESSSKNTLVYIFRNPAETEKGVGRWRREREYPVNHSAKTEGSIMFHTHTLSHTQSFSQEVIIYHTRTHDIMGQIHNRQARTHKQQRNTHEVYPVEQGPESRAWTNTRLWQT